MNKLNEIKILVVGDIMLDKYVIGEVKRISPEAPVGIVNVTKEYYTLGGCGNVVNNLRELGVQVDCCSSLGDDFNGHLVKTQLDKMGANDLLIWGGNKITTVKERIISDDRQVQMLRIDRENIKKVDAELALNKLKDLQNNYNMIIISDYAKGMITGKLLEFIKKKFSAKIIVDPKPSNMILYNDVYMITPNEDEWAQMVVSSAYTMNLVKFFLITKGKKGMTLIDNSEEEQLWDIISEEVPVFNASGAGDVVISVMTVCLSMGITPLKAANISNVCASYSVTQVGTSVIPKHIFLNNLKKFGVS